MAAPSLNIVKLAESERTVLLRANISEGGDADLSNLVLADISDYAESIGPAAVALSINRIWWSLDNMNVELKFEADTPVKALTLSGNGSYDFETIYGIKNPGGAGSTGSILLDTYGIAINTALGCVGSLIIELWKVRTGESGGELDAAATSSLFTPEVPEISGGIIIGGNSTASGYIKLLEDSDNGTNYIEIKAPAAVTANVTLTLPDGNGDANQYLQTDGDGNLSWATVDTSLSNDTTPVLGGDLDISVHKIISSSNGNVEIDPNGSGNVVVTSCNIVMSSGNGIDFSATADGTTMSSELFDDYEEGSWTPTVSWDANVASYSLKVGYYRVVGDVVFINMEVVFNTNVTITGAYDMYLTGLPFAAAHNSTLHLHSSYTNNDTPWTRSPMSAHIAANATQFYLQDYDTVKHKAMLNTTCLTANTSNHRLYISGFYIK